uniref:Uncharacterized protein n=1 Tax=Leersia perrieri TaxID=77586 RepID=A0A0D9VAZ6_9ORYZ
MGVSRGRASEKKGSWREEEDGLLRRLVAEHGAQRWSVISGGIPGRSGKSCRLRWCNQLSPGVEHRPFTAQEEAVLAAAHARHGNKWATIARLLPGRTDNSVKNHWNSNLRKTLRRQAKAKAKAAASLQEQSTAATCNKSPPPPLQLRRPSSDPTNYIVLDDDAPPPDPEPSLTLSLSLSLPLPAGAAAAHHQDVDDENKMLGLLVMRQLVREEVQRHTPQLAYSLMAMAACCRPPNAPN